MLQSWLVFNIGQKTAAEFTSPAQHLNFLNALDLITLAQKCEQMEWCERVFADGNRVGGRGEGPAVNRLVFVLADRTC